MSSTSSQPSPSASKNAQPDPIVSGSHFFPDRPALCEKRIPAAAVISVNRSGSGAGVACCGAGTRSHRGRLSIVVVNRLPFIVVLGAEQTRLFRKRLRGFISLEAAE